MQPRDLAPNTWGFKISGQSRSHLKYGHMIFMFIDYISKCGNKLAVHGLNAACRRVLLIQQNVLSRELEWMFQNVEISCKIWISGFSWKSRGPGARPQHPKQPPPRAGGHSPDGSSLQCHRCFLLSSHTEAECQLTLIFATANHTS